jgi:ABC-type multidrug transport system permease subunit
MRAALIGVGAIVRRDAAVFWSYRLAPVRELVGAVLTVALFYELAKLVTHTRLPGRTSYFAYAVVGLAALPMLRAGLGNPAIKLREEMIAGTFERMSGSPFGATASLLASMIFPFAVALLDGVIILLVAALLFGLGIDGHTMALALPIGLLTALAIAPFAVLLLAAGVLFKQISSGAGWMVAGLALLGGVYFPTALLPQWARWTESAQPISPALQLLRHSLTGAPIGGSAALDVIRLVVFAMVGLPVAALALAAACDSARRRGTLLEY